MDTKKRDKIILAALGILVVGVFLSFIINGYKDIKQEAAEQEAHENSIEGITEKMRFCYGAEDTTSLITMQQKLQKLHPDAAELDTINEYLAELRDKYAKLQVEWKKSFDRLKSNEDKFEQTTWYYNSLFTHNNFSNNVSLYIGKKGNKIWPCARISYTGSDWIFFDEITFLINGQTFTFAFDKYKDRDTEVSGGRVAEWVNMGIEYYSFIMLAGIEETDDVKIRMSGKYAHDRALTKTEKKALKEVADGYRYLLSTGCEGMNPD